MRKSEILRETAETKVNIRLNLDGSGKYKGAVEIGFLGHMLELFTKHGKFDLEIECSGDIYVDYHHLSEDIGIVLGKCINEALGDMKGIIRYGSFFMPMDEALTMVAIDISGRSYLNFDVKIPSEKIGQFDSELIKEFFLGLSRAFDATIHIKNMYGENSHHIVESVFKGFARALSEAVKIDEKYKNEIPSTKGVLV